MCLEEEVENVEIYDVNYLKRRLRWKKYELKVFDKHPRRKRRRSDTTPLLPLDNVSHFI